MSLPVFLIPVSLLLAVVGLGAFFWSERSGQYDDLDGDAERILFDDDQPISYDSHENSDEKSK